MQNISHCAILFSTIRFWVIDFTKKKAFGDFLRDAEYLFSVFLFTFFLKHIFLKTSPGSGAGKDDENHKEEWPRNLQIIILEGQCSFRS